MAAWHDPSACQPSCLSVARMCRSGKEATLVDTQGKVWTVVCLQPPNGAAFITGPGWRGMLQAWNAQLGDVLAFDGRQSQDAVHVTITRQVLALD